MKNLKGLIPQLTEYLLTARHGISWYSGSYMFKGVPYEEYNPLPMLCDSAIRKIMGKLPDNIKLSISDRPGKGFMRVLVEKDSMVIYYPKYLGGYSIMTATTDSYLLTTLGVKEEDLPEEFYIYIKLEEQS